MLTVLRRRCTLWMYLVFSNGQFCSVTFVSGSYFPMQWSRCTALVPSGTCRGGTYSAVKLLFLELLQLQVHWAPVSIVCYHHQPSLYVTPPHTLSERHCAAQYFLQNLVHSNRHQCRRLLDLIIDQLVFSQVCYCLQALALRIKVMFPTYKGHQSSCAIWFY